MNHDAATLARLGDPRCQATAVISQLPTGRVEIATFAEPNAAERRTDAAWPDAGIRSITFAVDGLSRLLNRLAGAGYKPAGKIVRFDTDGGPVLVAYVHGPDGVVLTFMEGDGG